MRRCRIAEAELCVSMHTHSHTVCVVHCRFWSELSSRHLMLQCQDIKAHPEEMCAVQGRKGHACVWDGRSSYLKDEGVQLSVMLCLTCSEVQVCIHPPSSVTSTHSSAMTALTSVCLLESFRFLQSRSCMLLQGCWGIGEALSGSQQTQRYMFSLPEKGACQQFATWKRCHYIWICCSCCCR